MDMGEVDMIERMFEEYTLETLFERIDDNPENDKEWLRLRRRASGAVVALIPWISDKSEEWNYKQAARHMKRTGRL